MCKKFIEELPKFSEGEKANYLYNLTKFEALKTPTLHSEICCPTCGGKDSYKVRDGKDPTFTGWSCVNVTDCVKPILPSDLEKSGMPGDSRKITLEYCCVPPALLGANFSQMEQSQNVVNVLNEFCKTHKGFLVLGGQSGRGKTYAAVCCMRSYLEKGDYCRFVNVADLYVDWLTLKQEGKSELNLLGKYCDVDLLVLDDVGTRAPTEAFLDFLYLIVNKRSTNPKLGTIITTNLNSKELGEKLGTPILSRISSGMAVRFDGKDRRLAKF